MKNAKLIKEYKLQKKETQLTRDILQIMTDRIVCAKYFEDNNELIEFKDICIYCHVSLQIIGDHWIYDKRYKFCPNFEQESGCKNTKCKNYKNYLNYYEAKNENEIAEKKLAEYPLWVKVSAFFQRKK